MKLTSCLGKFNGWLAVAGGWLQPLLLLGIRLYWGWHFAETGWGKLNNLDKVTAYFGNDLHLPMPRLNAIMAGSTECFGGTLLLLGLGSRFISIPLIFTMGVAYATAEKDALHAIFSDPDKFVTADPFLFLLAAVIVFAFGPGPLSLDRWFGFDPRGGRPRG
jgi:putative oxidoreductase